MRPAIPTAPTSELRPDLLGPRPIRRAQRPAGRSTGSRSGRAPRLSQRALEWFDVADGVEVDRTEENDAGAVPRLPARGRPGPRIRADRNQRQDQETGERVAE